MYAFPKAAADSKQQELSTQHRQELAAIKQQMSDAAVRPMVLELGLGNACARVCTYIHRFAIYFSVEASW